MYIDFPSVWRYFREYIVASGSILELKKALDWSIWSMDTCDAEEKS
ncbi:hypothetical protein [Pyrobaculum islandicum]|nr:hypothetical protein [Pyrobaculum islandicum]